MSQLIVLGRNGGKQEYVWRPEKINSARKAQRIFEEKIAEGYAAFKIFRASRKSSSLVQAQQELQSPSEQAVMGEQIHEFDSRAETIQMTPPMVGG